MGSGLCNLLISKYSNYYCKLSLYSWSQLCPKTSNHMRWDVWYSLIRFIVVLNLGIFKMLYCNIQMTIFISLTWFENWLLSRLFREGDFCGNPFTFCIMNNLERGLYYYPATVVMLFCQIGHEIVPVQPSAAPLAGGGNLLPYSNILIYTSMIRSNSGPGATTTNNNTNEVLVLVV